MWFNLAIISAVSKALSQALTKKLLRSYGVLEISTFSQLAATLIIFPLWFIPGLIHIPSTLEFQKAAWISITLNIITIIPLVEAIRRSDLSYALPFLGLTPVFSIVSAWLIRGEQVSALGVLGVVIVFVGALGIDVKSMKDWLMLGGKRVFKDKGVWIVSSVAFIYSISSVYDKVATLASDPLSFVWYSAVCRAAILVVTFYVWRKASYQGDMQRPEGLLNPALLFVSIGIAFNIESLSQMFALQTGAVAYVLAVKRLSILATSLTGILVFNERFTWSRFVGAFVMVAGATVIYFT